MHSILLLIPALMAQTPRVEFLGVAEVKSALNKATLWDVRATEEYLAGHIPGAINAGDAFTFLSDPTTEDFLPASELAAKLGQQGIDINQPIIVYGKNVQAPPFYAARALRFVGAKRVGIFIEGYPAWLEAKGAVEKTPSRRAPITLNATWLGQAETVDLNTFVSQQKKPLVQIVDVRSDDEFAGKDLSTLRGGHVPGALHIPARDNFTAANVDGGVPQLRRLKSKAELLAHYARKGLDSKKEIIVYCHSGGRSAATAEILRWLGFPNVKTYEGGWFEYGNNLTVPVEGATVFQVRETLEKMEKLEERVKTLEALGNLPKVDAGISH
jgi:thiosulfate/3-mercaptopyruvate sulfurtransferase